jgi:hypothetical protein
MHGALAQQLETIASRIRRRQRLTAAAWGVAATVIVVLSLMALDWRLALGERAARLMLSIALAAALMLIVRRFIRRAASSLTSLDVALDLERRHAELRSLLASALEFSEQETNAPTAGSLSLRRAVVLQASVAAETINMEEAIAREPLRRAALAALAAIVLLALPAAIAPRGFATGLVRLFNPLSDAQWPREHDLEFVSAPTIIPTGSDFHATLADRQGDLPPSVEVDVRAYRQGRWHVETQSYAAGGRTLKIVLPNV